MCEKKDKSGFRISCLSDDLVCPDLAWYTKISSTKKLPPRCPYANPWLCAHYYGSQLVLSKANYLLLDKGMVKRVEKHWKAKKLYPVADVDGPSLSTTSGTPGLMIFSNFCPEISYKCYGLFASSLVPHCKMDEYDRIHVERMLKRLKLESDDWRWSWDNITPLHFSDCPRYSILSQSPVRTRTSDGKASTEKMIEHFPSPPGLKWEDVSINFVSDDSIRIQALEITKRYLFSAIGFTDRRRGDRPDGLWELLKLFAKRNGRIDYGIDRPDSKRFMRMKASVRRLRKRLREIFGLEADPFLPYRKVKAYETKFSMSYLGNEQSES